MASLVAMLRIDYRREKRVKIFWDRNVGQPSQQGEAISIRRLYIGIQRGILYMVDIAEFRSGRPKGEVSYAYHKDYSGFKDWQESHFKVSVTSVCINEQF